MSDLRMIERLRLKANRASSNLIRTRTLRMVNERPIVSFTFDDFPKSAVSSGAAILEDKGAAGTYYVSRIFNGATVDGIEYYDLADVKRLVDNGHEIGCHTASHLRLPRVSRDAMVQDVEANSRFVSEHFGDLKMTTFAFPFGEINLATKFFAQERFAACRNISPGANRSVADLGALRSEKLFSELSDADSIRSLIETNAAPRTWLIFFTHDVAENPTSFGCTPALLESAANSALAAGYRILPVRNALDAIGFRPTG